MASPTSRSEPPEFVGGVYGLQLLGISAAMRPYLAAPDPAWPELLLRSGTTSVDDDRVSFTDQEARFPLPSGGEIVAHRSPLSAVVRLRTEPRPEELLHPYLGYVAATVSRWLGRESVHAGSFIVDGDAWAFVGDRGTGKTSLLGWLLSQGYDVVCDDVLVVKDKRVFAGPRFLDLRAEPASRLGVGEALGTVGARERWRVRVGEIPGEVPLGGWVFLDWGSTTTVERVPAAESIVAIRDQLSLFAAPRDPAVLLDLATLPAWRLMRPHGWESMADAVDRVLDAIAG
jgi:hypothetical protein